jgi:hypothetical protein
MYLDVKLSSGRERPPGDGFGGPAQAQPAGPPEARRHKAIQIRFRIQEALKWC